ncbi:MAG: ExeM/NucH family extracellular endonuclease [Gemmatimonadota bacterium]
MVATALAGCATREPTAPAPSPLSLSVLPARNVVISQVYGGGGNTGATYTHDFIELYNPGTESVSLSGWSVQYAAATGTNWSRTNLTGSIAPGGYYLIQQAAGAAGTVALPTPEVIGTIAMGGTGGKVALLNTVTTLPSGTTTGTTGCVDPAATPKVVTGMVGIQDFVGFGTTNCSESAPTAATSNTTAAIRRNGGVQDTDNNSADFQVAAPTPRNGASGPPTVSSTAPADGGTNVAPAGNVTVTFSRAVTVTPETFTLDCTVSGVHPAAVSGGPTSFTLDPATDFTNGEVCTGRVIAATVAAVSDAALRMAADYDWSFTIAATDPCTVAYTAPYTIQGTGATSTLVGQSVVTRGIVVGDYEGASPGLRGFYLQDDTGDGLATTSDAIFVFDFTNGNRVSVGDRVAVAGTVSENQGQTQVSGTTFTACGTGSVTPADVTFPVASPTFLEQFEGMLVLVAQPMYVTEHFQLGRFGQVVVSSGGRLAQPTNVTTPGAAALALQAQNDLNRLIVDDASQLQNVDPILFGRGGNPLSATNTLRGGDMVGGMVGVMTFTWSGSSASGNAYRLRPLNALGGALPLFVASNPRPMAPAAVGGTLKVGAMNLLNYFNTFGSACTFGVGGPNAGSNGCRGADNQAEFERQAAKTIAAILAMNADVLGIVEIENDGYGPASAIVDLITRLNNATAPGTWAFIDPDAATGQVNSMGSDAIKVGLIYKPARVTATGTTAVLNSAAFVNGGTAQPLNRAAIAQAFTQPNKARVVVSVNHFKSKSESGACIDAGDGQGFCNTVRVAAAQQLSAWLASDPTRTGETDALILGDLNAYAKEDPITTLQANGFTNLVAQFNGASAYSYAFEGQWGYLDHALGSGSLTGQVAGVTEWHINADEPAVLDYNVEFKSAGQVASLYAPDQYRVSDHDPIVVGLNLQAPVVFDFRGFLSPVANPPALNDANAGSVVPMKFTLGGDRGLDVIVPTFPVSRPVACDGSSPSRDEALTSTVGKIQLRYDAATGEYTYLWRTEKAWAGTCREFFIRLTDGTDETALFRFH